MIPILYKSDETAFTSNGLGRLSDCISCLVTEERNGKYEVEFTYPVSGIHYDDIQKGCIILADHDETGDKQPFIVYRVSAPINGICTYNCHHISYELANVIVEPITATSVADAFTQFTSEAMTNNPFTFWTDNVTAGTFTSEVPSSIRALLGGQSGSILDVFGGEYEFDGYTVKNHTARGNDNGVTIRYGKNLTDIEDTSDDSGTYNAVVPYWSDGQGTVVFGGIVAASGVTTVKAVSLDLSSEFEEAPTVAQLETKASTYLSNNQPWLTKQNLKIDFVALWQTEEYKNIAPLERVGLCDTVHVIHPDMNINVTAKVIKTTWDVIADRYSSIELGEAKSSFADTILGDTNKELTTTLRQYAKKSAMTEAIDHATQLITGGLGGYIKFLYNANDEPTDMLVMDSDDASQAVNVLRINVNGIGFSSTGPSGPFTSAWTLDGSFVADFITAGTMSANRIQGGTLTLGGLDNGNGVLRLYDASGTEIGSFTNAGITLNKGRLQSSDGNVYFDLTNNKLVCSEIVTPDSGTHLVGKTRATSIGTIGYFEMNGGSYSSYIQFDLGMTPGASAVISSPALEITGDEGKHVLSFDSPNGMMMENLRGRSSIELLDSGYIDIEARNAKTRFTGGIAAHSLANVSAYPSGSFHQVWYDSNSEDFCQGYISSSSKRYKHDISEELDEELKPERLYDLKIKQFVFNEGHPLEYADMAGKTLPGFIAEDVAEIYPSAVITDKGEIENWDERRILPGMLALIQEQKKTVDEHEARIKAVEEKIEILMEALKEND